MREKKLFISTSCNILSNTANVISEGSLSLLKMLLCNTEGDFQQVNISECEVHNVTNGEHRSLS